MRVRIFIVGCLVLPFFWLNAGLDVGGTNYYVDFQGGRDGNPGTSMDMPWKTIPGTRSTDGQDWVSTHWGGIDERHKVPAGSTIYLKSGTRYDHSIGGFILLDPTFYSSGTEERPVSILRHPSWGKGKVVFDGTNLIVPKWRAILDILGVKFLTIDGLTPSGITVAHSTWNCIRCLDSGANGLTLRNLELSDSDHAPLFLFSSEASKPVYLSGVELDGLTVHDGKGVLDDDSLIYAGFLENFVIQNSTAYRSGKGSDGIHLGSCRNGWVLNCETSGCGEQGIDLSRDGDYKKRDDSYAITVRDCISHDNRVNNFDHNSGTHHVYWINCASWRTTSGELGDAGFNVHQGTAGPNWWIYCTSTKSSDRGFNFAWDGNPWNIPPGEYRQTMINCVSSGDSIRNGSSGGGSVWIGSNPSNRITAPFRFDHCDFHTGGRRYGVVNDRGRIFRAEDLEQGGEGWPGIQCISKDPMWKQTDGGWSREALQPAPGSPCRGAGVFPFATRTSAAEADVLLVDGRDSEMDASRVFRTGDSIEIEAVGVVRIKSVARRDEIRLSNPVTWKQGKGVWLAGRNAIQIGADLTSKPFSS